MGDLADVGLDLAPGILADLRGADRDGGGWYRDLAVNGIFDSLRTV